jgi:hypothetical protein
MQKETYAEFRRRIARNLTRLVEESGLSQRDQILAGLDPRYILRIKKGEINISIRTIWKISHIMDFDPMEIFE